MEQITSSAITQHIQENQGIRPSQHGFRRSRSYLTNLISFYDKGIHLDEGKAVDVPTWMSAKPLTPFPTASPAELQPAAGQLVSGHQWCPPGISVGPRPIQHLS